MSIQLRDGFANRSIDHVLEDLLVRFLVNSPNEDLSSSERVLFQVEEAQWFYTDFIRQLYPGLPSMKMKSFSAKMLQKCPLIWKWGDANEALSRFGKYKSSIPVRGIALFNSDLTKVLLVKGYESNSWSFPRGKISKDEDDMECAVREVEEETGFNAKDLINEKDVVDRTIKGKNYKIYLVKNVPEDFDFKPIARNEIEKIEWFDIKILQKKLKLTPNHFFILPAVIKPIMKWVANTKGTVNESDLILEAEVKLKNIMGIGREILNSNPGDNQPVNDDAGRELLDILQGVKQTEVEEISSSSSSDSDSKDKVQPEPVTFNIPQSMAAPYAHLMDLNGVSSFVQESTLPFFQGIQAKASNMDQSISTPTPESLEKPTSSLVNSKELLSILTSKETVMKASTLEGKTSDGTLRNKAKAQELLNRFKKDSQLPVTSDSELLPGKATVLEENEKSERFNPLLDMLKGGESRSSPKPIPKSPSSPANKLLDLLKKPSEPSTNKDQSQEQPSLSSTASTDILQMLRPQADSPLISASSVASSADGDSNDILQSIQPTKSKPAKDLLNLLKLPSVDTNKESVASISSPVTPSRPSETSHKSAQSLMDLLGQPSVEPNSEAANKDTIETPEIPERKEAGQTIADDVQAEENNEDFEDFEDFENFEDFEDFENFDKLNDEIQATTQEFQDEELQRAAEDNSQRPVSNDASHVQSSVFDSKPTTTDGPSRGSVRILKPGQSMSSLLGEDRQLSSHQASGGQELLSVLQRGPGNSNQGSGADSSGLSSIYGTPSPQLQNGNVPFFQQKQSQPIHNSTASNSLLGLLNGSKGSSPIPKSETDSSNPNSKPKTAANDLLNLLKRPTNE